MHCILCKNKTETLVFTASHKKLQSEGVLTLTLLLQVTSGGKGLCGCVFGEGGGSSQSKFVVCDVGGCLPGKCEVLCKWLWQLLLMKKSVVSIFFRAH